MQNMHKNVPVFEVWLQNGTMELQIFMGSVKKNGANMNNYLDPNEGDGMRLR